MPQFLIGFILCTFLAITSNGCSSSSAQSMTDPFPTGRLDFASELGEIGKLGDGRLVLMLWEPATGGELYVSDGTPEGTEIIVDLNPGPADGAVHLIADFNGGVYFVGDDPATGWELWFTDGTPEGTVLIDDATTGPGDSRVLQGLVDSDSLHVSVDRCWNTPESCGSSVLTIAGSPN